MTKSQSPIAELIRSKNPFAGNNIVTPSQIWGKSFPDVPSINAHASDAVFEAVNQIAQKQRQTVGITITAEKGLGKSHLISRIRHCLQAESSTLFVYISKYDNLNQIKYQFLQTTASSLRAFGSFPGVMQWQELAAALINQVKHWNYTPQQYIDIFPSWLNKHSHKAVDNLTNLVLQAKHYINNPYLVKAVLWTLSTEYAIYATHWLSGMELNQDKAEFMGLTNPKTEDRETESLTTVRQILDITSDYKVPVICFDELDTIDIDDNGFTTAQVVGNLAKDLYNNIKAGVLLLAMYPETWRDQVRSLPQAEAVMDRLVSEQANRQPLTLNYLNSDEVVAIVSQWLQEFYQENQQTPPHPLYPYEESQLKGLGKHRPTVRSLLKWCADNFQPPEDRPEPHPVEHAYKQKLVYLHKNLKKYWTNKTVIVEALKLNFATLVGETVEGVRLTEIAEIQASRADQGYIDFKIIGEENGQTVKIGVAVIQESRGKGIGAALNRLINYQKFDITRGCLVRSDGISATARRARKSVHELLRNKGGEWVLLREADLQPLLAILLVNNTYQQHGLSQEQIRDFIVTKKLAIENHLLRDILSDSSH